MAKLNRDGLDTEALAAAKEALKKFWYERCDSPTTGIFELVGKMVEVSVNAYMNDLIRQLNDPCAKCTEKEDHHDGSK